MLFRQGRRLDALDAFDEAIAREPRSAIAHSNRAHVLNTLERYAETVAAADQALALDAGLYFAWRARGQALLGLDRPGEAVDSYRAAVGMAGPAQRAMAQADVGLALAAEGRLAEAIAAYDAAETLDPRPPLIAYRRANARLLQRDFAGGWDDYEARWRPGLASGPSMGQMTEDLRARLTLAPTPADFAGARVLVIGEQGVGDQIMFASVLPDLIAVAASVACLVDPRLVRLVSHAFPQIELLAGLEPRLLDLTRFDRIVAMGSLPAAFRRTEGDFPGQAYLRPRPGIADAWRTRLGPADGRRRIGLSWRGGVKSTGATARSMPLEMLRPLLERPDCAFVSLQYGDVAADLAGINATMDRPIASFPPGEIDDFEDLAGLIGALDLVVTVQTTVAHLSGALGQPALVMIPRRPEWRYTAQGDHIPWYGSLTLLRQRDDAGWAPVIARAGQVLDAHPR